MFLDSPMLLVVHRKGGDPQLFDLCRILVYTAGWSAERSATFSFISHVVYYARFYRGAVLQLLQYACIFCLIYCCSSATKILLRTHLSLMCRHINVWSQTLFSNSNGDVINGSTSRAISLTVCAMISSLSYIFRTWFTPWQYDESTPSLTLYCNDFGFNDRRAVSDVAAGFSMKYGSESTAFLSGTLLYYQMPFLMHVGSQISVWVHWIKEDVSLL